MFECPEERKGGEAHGAIIQTREQNASVARRIELPVDDVFQTCSIENDVMLGKLRRQQTQNIFTVRARSKVNRDVETRRIS